jgi:hypothetical protein
MHGEAATTGKMLGATRGFDRMNLFSMIPLNVDHEHSTPTRGSALDMKVSAFSGAMANFTRSLDTMTSACDELPPREVLLPQVFEHHRTPFKPTFKNKMKSSPGPSAYDPKYGSVRPRIPQTTLPPRSRNPPRPALSAMSTADVVSLYQTRLRDFEPDEVVVPALSELQCDSKPQSPALSMRRTGGERDPFGPQSPARYLAPSDPPPARPPAVREFEMQVDREVDAVRDSDRFYEHAADQQRRALKRTPTAPRFDEQTTRWAPPKKNERVKMLHALTQKQHAYIARVTAKSRAGKAAKPPGRPSSFREQRARSPEVFPTQTQLAGDTQFPFDPIESYRRTVPRTLLVEIHPKGKELVGGEFWEVRRGHQ